MQYFDYSSPAYYFITICTKNKIKYFGRVVNSRMEYNDAGIIAMNNWECIPIHFNHARLDEYIVMPNHIHGIIQLTEPLNDGCETQDVACVTQDVACNVPTRNNMSKISPKRGSISTIVRSYKSACTNWINDMTGVKDFGWQPRFYEHVIRNEKSLNRIREYIRQNPKNWKRDKLYK